MKVFYYTIFILSLLILGAVTSNFVLKQNLVNDFNHKSKKNYSIKNTWKMPKELREISGISWVNDSTIACIEDEDGIIFMYNLKQDKIQQEIPFGKSGDYEAITINKSDAYVMRSDGKVFEIKDFQQSSRKTTSFKTEFSSKNNMESLVFDKQNNRLITIPKDKDLNSKDHKGLYTIPLDSKKLNNKPVYRINMEDDELKDFQKKKLYKTFYPSDVAIHPLTQQFYILDGRKPKLIILNQTGKIDQVLELDEDQFPQPEGLTFSPKGKLYISTEGRKHKAAIMEVEINK